MKAPIIHSYSWSRIAASLLPFGALLVLNAWLAPALFPIGAAVLHLVAMVSLRRVFTHAHRTGIRLIKVGNFAAAIPVFQKSYEDMCQRPWIDRYRWFILGSSSRWSYREMALANCAFCFGQVGDGRKMKEYYDKTLAEFPQSVLATTALRMLNSASQVNAPNQST